DFKDYNVTAIVTVEYPDVVTTAEEYAYKIELYHPIGNISTAAKDVFFSTTIPTKKDIEDMVSGFVKKQSEALAQKENKLPSDEKTLQSLDKAMQKIEERKRLKQEEELLQDNDLTDDEIRGIIGGDNARGVLDYLKKAEDYFDKQKEAEEYLEGINRRRVVSNANKIKSLEGSDVLKLEYFFEALNYEYLFADNWESFRETLAMGGIVDNYEAVRRFIEV